MITPVELQNLRLQHPQLGAKSGNTGTGNLRHPFVICIRDDTKQLLNTIAPDRRNDAELGKMGTDGIDHRVCWRMNRWRVRWSIRQLCCSGVLVSTNRMLAWLTASQIASASVASFFCRLT